MSMGEEKFKRYVRSPSCYGHPAKFNLRQEGKNPFCGDDVVIYLSESEAGDYQLSFEGHGCSVTMASASLMLEHLNKLPLEKRSGFLNCLLTTPELCIGNLEGDEAESFLALREIWKNRPNRANCVTLPWKTGDKLLSRYSNPDGNDDLCFFSGDES